MVRVASERIADLFALAEREAAGGSPTLADRYVRLARTIGMRYNVRLLPEYAELYCRGCSRYWVEGRTVRTRLRSGARVRTCLGCGRERRVPYRVRRKVSPASPAAALRALRQPEVGWLGTARTPEGGDGAAPGPQGR